MLKTTFKLDELDRAARRFAVIWHSKSAESDTARFNVLGYLLTETGTIADSRLIEAV